MVKDSYEKISIVPVEGDHKDQAISTTYNPKELSFTKSVGWSDDNVGAETDCPSLAFTAGQAITLSLELLFDFYEEENQDVRPMVKKVIDLCKIQDIDDGSRRPPKIILVWGDKDPIGVENFCGVVESAQTKYTMFTSAGIPCRASVTVAIKQAEYINYSSKTVDANGNVKENKTVYLGNMSPAEAASTPGMKEALEKKGAKIEDKSTWPDSITYEVTEEDDSNG